MLIFFGIILTIVGVVMIVNPDLVWFITQRWKTEDGTVPSRLYVLSTRFGGIVITLVGIASIVGPLVTKG